MKRIHRALLAIAALISIASGAPVHAAGQDLTAQTSSRVSYSSRDVARVFQNFHLSEGDHIEQVVVIYGNATIDGEVDDDLQVYFGDVHLGKTAVIRHSVVAIGGNVTIEEGATVRRDLIVVGGIVTSPPSFFPGGSHIAIGTTYVAASIRRMVPWFNYGPLLGRLVVPTIAWVWLVVFSFFAMTLALDLILSGPVGKIASTLSARPLSAFATGLLVLLLVGPLSALLIATIIGIVVIPFLLAALVSAWIIGKVAVARWIGRAIFSRDSEPETRMEGLREVSVGFAGVIVLYMIPVVGLVSWAIFGVIGLGAATQFFFSALRRERPQKSKPTPVAAPPRPQVTPFAATSAPFVAEPELQSGVDDEPQVPQPEPQMSWQREPQIPPQPEPPIAPVPPPPSFPAGDPRGLPRATFFDRLAALALDVIVVAIFSTMVFSHRYVRFGDGPFEPMLFIAYAVVFWTWQGTTLGGIVCNLRIVKANGRPFEFVDAVVRAFGGVLSLAAFGIGFLWVLRDSNQQGWHDKIAGTIVVRVPKDTPLR